jgi:moderate conductance mechanosensitive channel
MIGGEHLPFIVTKGPTIRKSEPHRREGCVLSLRKALLALVLTAATVAAGGAAARPATPPSSAAIDAVSTVQLRELVHTLDDDAERRKLIDQIDALIAVRSATPPVSARPPKDIGARIIGGLSDEIHQANAAFSALAGGIGGLSGLSDWARAQIEEPQERGMWLHGVITLVLAVTAAFSAERATRLATRRLRRGLSASTAVSLSARLILTLARILLDWARIFVFVVAGYVVLFLSQSFLEPNAITGIIVLSLINANALVRGFMIAADALLGPSKRWLLSPQVSEETAGYWLIWLRRLARLLVYGYFVASAALLIGLPAPIYAVASKLFGLIVAGVLLVLLLQNRDPIARRIRGIPHESESAAIRTLRDRFAETWHVLAVLYIAGIYGVWALSVPGGFIFVARASAVSVLVLLAARGAAGLIKAALGRFVAISPEMKRRFPGLEARADRYFPALVGGLRSLLYLAAFLIALQAWNLDVFGWLTSDVGRRIIGSLVTIVIAAGVALIIWEAVSLSIEYYLLSPATNGQAVERSARARTLLPLLRNTVAIFLIAVVALIALSELGINIAPLLAGAGIVGLAVGFGAQTLVKDIITGLFILLQDTVSVGDVVSVAGSSGLVEAISIRTIRLRDLNGTVHTIPFSEVGKVQNMTKDFSYALLDVGVAYRENVDEVIDVIRKLGDELQATPKYGPLILEPIDIWGLDRFEDSAVIVRARIKTRPIQQWTVMREFNRRLKQRFDELGIEIPYPHQTLYFGSDKRGEAPAAHLRVDPETLGRILTAVSPGGRARFSSLDSGREGGGKCSRGSEA